MEAVKGVANSFLVRGVYRSVAKTLDGLRSEGYSGGKLTWRWIPKNKVKALARQYVLTPSDVLHILAPAPSGGVSEVSTARRAERASAAEAQRGD